jgi:hypothetical protein
VAARKQGEVEEVRKQGEVEVRKQAEEVARMNTATAQAQDYSKRYQAILALMAAQV